MQQKTFTQSIQAPPEKVWQTLWNDDSYRQWTQVFSEGSYAVSDWQQGSKVQFLSPGGNGMYSLIEQLVPNEIMSFKHQGEIKNGAELPPDEKTKSWVGALETYTLTQQGTATLLTVTMDMDEAAMPYFEAAFPKALQKVAALAEG